MKRLLLLAAALYLSGTLTGCVAAHFKDDAANFQNQLDACKTDSAKQKAGSDKQFQDQAKTLSGCQNQLLSVTKDRGQMQSSLNDLNKAMNEMKQRQEEEQKRLNEFRDLTSRFKTLTDSGTLSVKILDGKMVVSLGSDVLFPSGSSRLSPAGRQAIKEVSKQLTAIPGKRYQVEGHTDNVPISTAPFPSNWELASARAITVMKAMIEDGMPAARVSAASYGETSPVKPNETPEGRAANRRIAIVVVPDLSSLPGYDELKKLSQ